MDSTNKIERRIIATGLVWNSQNELLLCKMPNNRGVFPDQWGLPGGGIEPNEKMEDGLRRELREELRIEVRDIKPAFFKDGQHMKSFPDGSKREIYMIFLLFHCMAIQENISLNEEFTEYKWVREDDLPGLEMNPETIDTLKRIGHWDAVWA